MKTETLHIAGQKWIIHRYEAVDSTNLIARRMGLEGAPDRTVILAEEQRSGRGRLTRKWFSPRGGLWLSLVLRPEIEARECSKLMAASALAVAETIREVCGLSPSIKWPNDILVEEKKVSGILLELECCDGRVSFVVVGIGVNLNIGLAELPEEVRALAGTLKDIMGTPVDHERFLRTFLQKCECYYSLFKSGRHDKIVDEWRRSLSTVGRKVRVIVPGETVEGQAVGVGDDCSLLICSVEGETKAISVGDCIHLR